MIRFLQTPGPAKKIFLTAILLFIAVTMVITLIPGGFLGESLGYQTAGVLARVGGEEVSVYEVDQRAQQVRAQRNVPAQFMPLLRQQAAEGLILQKAMMAEARRLGLRVSDEELRDELQNGIFGQQLFPGGKFVGQEGYENFVSQYTRLSVPQFEAALKEELLVGKLRAMVEEGVTVSPQELQQEFERQNTRVKLEYAVVTPESVMGQIKPAEQELKAYYERNREARYKNAVPERRQAKYAVVDTARLAEKVQVTREDLLRYYNENKEQFRQQEEVNVRHILVKTPPAGPDGKVDPQAVESARKKAQEVLNQIKAGGNFEALARKYSEDTSAANGGSLGWVGRGRTVPEFEKAAFSLQPGQVSELVQSTFGFHIIRVDEKHSPRLPSLDEVRAQIEPAVRQQKAARQAENLSNSLQAQARSSSLEAAASKNGLQVIDSDFFTRTDSLPGLGAAPQFLEAVFNASEKSAPSVVAIPEGFVLYQVMQVKPAATPSFEEVRARVEADFKQERATALVQQRTRELSDRARAAHDLKKAAKELGLSTRTSELVGANSQVPELGTLAGPAAVAFDLKPGEISGPIDSGANGAVLTVLQRNEPSLAELDQAKDQIRSTLLQNKRDVVMRMFAENLRERMQKEGKIRYNKDEQERIFNTKLGSTGS